MFDISIKLAVTAIAVTGCLIYLAVTGYRTDGK